MTEAFLKIVNRSISAGWLVLAVLVLRFALKKAPKWVSVLLWGIVAVRLICPFSIESALSLIPSRETISPEIMMDWTPEITTGIAPLDQVVNPVISTSLAPDPGASANPLQILIPVAANLWLLGVLVMLAYTAITYLQLRRKLTMATILRENIFQCETVRSPFVLGILKPRIYLPYGMDSNDLHHVIAHEQAHIRRKDHWWKPLGFLLLTVYWFNPLIWVAHILLCRDIELACDEKVIAQLGNEQRADYTQALVACSVNRRMIAACPLAFGEVGVKERVRSVMNYRKPGFWIILIAVILCLVLAVSMLTDPVAKTTPAEIVSTLEASDVQWAQATIWDVPAGDHIMLNERQIGELVSILQSLEPEDFQEKTIPNRTVSVMLYCGEMEILLLVSDDLVQFTFDTQTAQLITDVDWSTDDETLLRFIDELTKYSWTASTIEWADRTASAVEWVDYEDTAGFDLGAVDLTVPVFPGVLFQCDGYRITADGETVIQGMPILNAYLTDLNGDDKPEICATVSFGSGMIDTHVVVYDYANRQEYTLWDRGEYDYSLRMDSGMLICEKYSYPSGTPMDRTGFIEGGRLILIDAGGGSGKRLAIDLLDEKSAVMQPTETNLRGFYGGYLFTNFNGATYRYAMTEVNPQSVTADQLLLTFSEETPIEGIAWEVYSLKEYPDGSKVLAISGTNSAWLCEYAPPQRAEESALEAARAAGYVIEEDCILTDGQDAWNEFYEKTQRGEQASIHVAHYLTLDPDRTVVTTYEAYKQDYPSLFVDELTYDGEKFILRTESKVTVYEYLMRYDISGTPLAGHTEHKQVIHYVLAHDPSHTYEELFTSLTSSALDAMIPHYTICTEQVP